MQNFCKPKVDFPFIFGNSHLIRTKVELWLVYVNELMGEEHYSCGKFQAIWWQKKFRGFFLNVKWGMTIILISNVWQINIVLVILHYCTHRWMNTNQQMWRIWILVMIFSEDHENENLCCMIYVSSLMFVGLCMLFINMSIWWSYDFKG
jgi:hypothetical protein